MESVLERAAQALLGWRGYAVVFAMGALLAGAGAWVWQANGYERQLSERGRELAELRASHAGQLASAADQARDWESRYRESERNAGLARDNAWAQARKDADNEKVAAAAALAEYRAGTRRLSLAIGDYQARSSRLSPDAAAASGSGQARAELDPATGGALYAIAVDGNAGIRDANACIDIYNRVRAQLDNAVAAAVP
ncbi:hypothetical protein PO002_04950 [Cupriavidus necator]|uniref:hypothetical protein n=1 Tax=Cupriavidus necator TaxID=106590 RepID=UPI0039C3E6B5